MNVEVECERRTYRVEFDGQGRLLSAWRKLDAGGDEAAVDLGSPLGRMVVDLARARLAMEARSRRSRSQSGI